MLHVKMLIEHIKIEKKDKKLNHCLVFMGFLVDISTDSSLKHR